MKNLLLKSRIVFSIIAILIISSCSNDDDENSFSGSIIGTWNLGNISGNATYSGVNMTISGFTNGSITFNEDETYSQNITNGEIVISAPSINYSETTIIDPDQSTGIYSYNFNTKVLTVDGEASEVVALNSNYMKVKTNFNDSGVEGIIYTEYNR